MEEAAEVQGKCFIFDNPDLNGPTIKSIDS